MNNTATNVTGFVAYRNHWNDGRGVITLHNGASASDAIAKLQRNLAKFGHATGVSWQCADGLIEAMCSKV